MKSQPPRPDEWRKLYELRDDLDGEDRMLLRKLIHYTEHLERELKAAHVQLHKERNDGE
jgi:hypothetical protein